MNPPAFQCLCCGSAQSEPFLLQCKDLYMGKPGQFDYLSCKECGLVQIHPIPADLDQYYETYQVHQRKSWLHELIRPWMMRGVYYKLPAPGKAGARRVLDFGCGDGWYLRQLALQGHEAIGFESNPAYASKLAEATGLTIYSDLQALKNEQAERFDCITMHFVLEHVSDLLGTFRLAQHLLKPGGCFYFVIPNMDALEARLFGRNWHYFDPPRHLSFPTLRVIEHLAAASGLVIESKKTFGSPNDLSGTLSNVFLGRYDYRAFCAFMPLAMLWCATGARGNLAVELTKK